MPASTLMEQIHYNPLLLLLALLLLLLFRFTSTRRPSGRLPPGPSELPILGGIHHLLGGSPLLHRVFQEIAQKHGPLMHLRLGEVLTIIVSSADVAKEILKTHDVTFADRAQTFSLNILSYGFNDLIFAPYGEHWRQLRKISVLELFSLKRVQSFQLIREEEVLRLVRSIYSANGSPINLSKMLYSLTNNITVHAVMGNRQSKHQEEYLELLAELIKLSGGFSLADLFPSLPLVGFITGMMGKLQSCHRKLDRVLNEIIEEHKLRRTMEHMIKTSAPREEDLLDVLLKIQDEGRSNNHFQPSDDCIKALVFDMFGAGSETSGNVMEWAMTELVKNPKVMEKVQSEVRHVIGVTRQAKFSSETLSQLNYLKAIIKETLRLHPPAPFLGPRECRETCQVLGYDIPVKARVLVNVWAMGRDPQYWDAAEEFKPERFDGNPIDFKGASFEYIPFGAGRRICPGISFGLATMELALAHLLYYFDWKLPNAGCPHDVSVEEVFGITVRKKSNLVVCAIPHVPCPAALDLKVTARPNNCYLLASELYQ